MRTNVEASFVQLWRAMRSQLETVRELAYADGRAAAAAFDRVQAIYSELHVEGAPRGSDH